MKYKLTIKGLTPELHFSLLPIINTYGEYVSHILSNVGYIYIVEFRSETLKQKFDKTYKFWAMKFLR